MATKTKSNEKQTPLKFTLQYWLDDGWYVGKLVEIPGVFSQGESLADLEFNIIDAYKMVMKSQPKERRPKAKTKAIMVPA